jgi:integrase
MSIRKLPNGRYEWRHRVGGRHLKKTFERRSDAVAHDSKIRADVARGAHVDLTNKTTVAEYFQSWIEGRVIRPSTAGIYRNVLKTHIEPLPLGSRPLAKVRPSEIQAWVRSRTDVLAPYTLRIYTGLLRSAFETAVLDGLAARNPVQPAGRMSLPRMDKRDLVPLTVAQVSAWAEHAAPRVQGMILTQAGLGLRISELRALRIADVDFLRREVRIIEQLDKACRRVPLKTANSRREVPLPSVTADVLALHIATFPPGPDGLIFTSITGAWSDRRLGQAYRDAARAAGLPVGTTSHDLRHHYASVLLDAGESVHAVAARLGNTAQMVLNVYGHLMPDREDTTRRAVDVAWAAAQNAARGTAQK